MWATCADIDPVLLCQHLVKILAAATVHWLPTASDNNPLQQIRVLCRIAINEAFDPTEGVLEFGSSLRRRMETVDHAQNLMATSISLFLLTVSAQEEFCTVVRESIYCVKSSLTYL
jgi:hypothetical protein